MQDADNFRWNFYFVRFISLFVLYPWIIQDNKEATNMKTAVVYRNAPRHAVRYPNAADRRQMFNKFIDRLLIGAIGIGFATILLFLAALA